MLDITTILLDAQNVELPALRAYLSERAANNQIDVLATATDGVTAHAYWRTGYESTPMTVGMLGGPEANIGFNFGYNGSSHSLFDTTFNAWSMTLGNGGYTLQYIPAGTNTPGGGLDPWQSRGRVAQSVDTNGRMLLGFGITGVPSPFSTGSSVELGGSNGAGIWGAAGATYLLNNFYYNAGDKFAGTGYAAYLSLAGGAFSYYASSASGAAGGAATMAKKFGVSEAGVVTMSAYGTGGVVTVGAADSGGAGFKLLRVPN